MAVKLASIGLLVLVGGLASGGASGSGRHLSAGRTGVVLTSRGGRILAVNVDGSGVRELTRPSAEADGSPVASPDGAAIAFERGFDVYVLNADGTNLRRVGPGGSPEWSPDGGWLAATTYTDRIYVMKADGTSVRRIARGTGPAWSPDGRWLAYQGDYETDSSVHVVRLDGTKTLRLPNASDYAWSPDGRRLGYANSAGLWVIDVMSFESREIVKNSALGRGVKAGGISWSPDGGRMAFGAEPDYYNPFVYVTTLDGSPPRRVGPRSVLDEIPVWSPDGTRLAYTTPVGEGQRVVVADVASGRTVWKLRPIAGLDSAGPSWSADGSELVFLRWNRRAPTNRFEGTDVWVINADGTGAMQLTTAFPFDGVGEPTWWPRRTAVVPDPPVPTLALKTVARRRARGAYDVVGADGNRLATGGIDIRVSYHGGLAPWRRIDGGFVNSVAFGSKRVYWAVNDLKDSSLWTAARPGARARVLRDAQGEVPWFSVQSDRSLAAFTLNRSLFRLRDRHVQHIRHERKDIRLVDIDRGRILLLRSDGRLELVSRTGRLLRSFSSRSNHIRDGQLSGRRVVAVGSRRILVFDARTGRLRASWQVGAPGIVPSAGFIYKALLPYADGSALHVVDVDTGHDLVVRIPGVTEPVDGAVTKRGLLYTWTATYSKWEGRLGLVPLRKLKAALATAKPVG